MFLNINTVSFRNIGCQSSARWSPWRQFLPLFIRHALQRRLGHVSPVILAARVHRVTHIGLLFVSFVAIWRRAPFMRSVVLWIPRQRRGRITGKPRGFSEVNLWRFHQVLLKLSFLTFAAWDCIATLGQDWLKHPSRGHAMELPVWGLFNSVFQDGIPSDTIVSGWVHSPVLAINPSIFIRQSNLLFSLEQIVRRYTYSRGSF